MRDIQPRWEMRRLRQSRQDSPGLGANSGRAVLTLDASADVRCVAISPDGRRIAAGTFNSTAKVWDLSGLELVTYRSRAQSIKGIAFSPDGRQIATGDSDGFIKVWDPDNGKDQASLRAHTGAVLAWRSAPMADE